MFYRCWGKTVVTTLKMKFIQSGVILSTKDKCFPSLLSELFAGW